MRHRFETIFERAQTPAQIKHCVAKVAEKHGGDTSKAFAICVAAGQKNGTLKPGSIKSTSKGKRADSAKKAQDGHDAVVAGYEDLLARSRKSESTMAKSILAEMYRLLGEAPLTKPETHGAVNKPAKKTNSPKVAPPNVTGGNSPKNKNPGPIATPKNKTTTKQTKVGPSK